MQETRSEIDTPEGRDWLLKLLREQEVKVTFTKKNGDERIMTCTLNFDTIPEEHRPKAKVEEEITDTNGLTWDDLDQDQEEIIVPEEPKNLAVYDVNAKGWRSFLWANVKQVEFSLEKQNG